MDIKKYIASGILEQYVLGLVSRKDRQEIEQYILKYPEIKKEVDQIEKSLELYAEGNQIKASENLETKILEAVENTSQELPSEKAPVVAKPRAFSGIYYLLAAYLLGIGALGYWFYSIYQKSKSDLIEQQNVYQELRDDCTTKDSTIQLLNDQIDILLNVNYENKPLINQETPDLATVYYNSTDKKSYFSFGNLPTPPSDRQYQLWALVNGAPVDMGVFQITPGDSVLLEVPFIENAGAFAITLEPFDNDPAPNLDELVVITQS